MKVAIKNYPYSDESDTSKLYPVICEEDRSTKIITDDEESWKYTIDCFKSGGVVIKYYQKNKNSKWEEIDCMPIEPDVDKEILKFWSKFM